MEMISSNHLSATKQTWRQATTVREIFASIVDANPSGKEGAWRRAFLKELKNNEESLEAVSDYAFDAALRAYALVKKHKETRKFAQTAETQKQEEDLIAQKATKFVKERIILLNQEMPNGKRARNCTLNYFYQLGGSYKKIGKRGDQTLVGSKYSEEEFRIKLGLSAI